MAAVGRIDDCAIADPGLGPHARWVVSQCEAFAERGALHCEPVVRSPAPGHGPAEAHIAKVLPKPLPPVGPITSNPRGHDARSRLTGRPRFARKGWQQRASHCCIQFNSVSSDLSRATSRTLGSSEAGCRWYARFCDRGVIERKSHERGPRGKDRYGTITNPNPASRGARGLAPIPVHRLKAPLRRGIFPTNHSGYDARTWSHAFLFSPYGTGSRRHLNERFSAPEVLKPIRSRRLNRLREERCHPPWQQRTNLRRSVTNPERAAKRLRSGTANEWVSTGLHP